MLLAMAWLLSGALAAWAARAIWHGLRLVWASRYARQQGFHELKTGSVALRGKVVPLDALEAPETGRPCVYVSLTVDRWDKTATMGGFSGQWLRMEDSEEVAPFKITDGTHSILVEPDGGRFHALPAEPGQRKQDDGSEIRFTEQIIQEGDEVLVVGQAHQRGGFEPSAAYRGHNYRTVISRGDGELKVIRPPAALTKKSLGTVGWWSLGLVPFLGTSWAVALVLAELYAASQRFGNPLF